VAFLPALALQSRPLNGKAKALNAKAKARTTMVKAKAHTIEAKGQGRHFQALRPGQGLTSLEATITLIQKTLLTP